MVDTAADDQFTAFGLVDVRVKLAGRDRRVHEGLERLGDKRLERVGEDRHVDVQHVGDGRCPARGRADDEARSHTALDGLDTRDPTVLADDPRDLGERVQLDAEPVGGTGVAPDNPVVPGDSRGWVV